MTYFGIALFCTGVFLIDLFIFGDLDNDDTDLISFNGLVNFCMGFSWCMWIISNDNNVLLSGFISSGVGFITTIILCIVCRKFIMWRRPIGKTITIFSKGTNRDEWIAYIGQKEILALSRIGKIYIPGEKTKIISYTEGRYWIP